MIQIHEEHNFLMMKYLNIQQTINMFKLIGLILASIIGLAQAQLTHVDFLYDPVYTNSYFWWNYVGITMNFTEIQPFYNTSLFQGYLQNSNLKGNWYNNFMGSVRHPKGYFYNCAALGLDNTTGCSHQLAGTTYFPKFGQFVWNTMNQPYWTYGVNNQKLDLLDTDTMDSMYSYYMDIYKYTHYVTYMIEMMWEGDKAVQNGMRDNFTVADFLSDAWQYEQILYGLSYKSPGITETASSQWLGNLTQFYDQCWQGIFTFESVIFTDPTLATIQNLLSDNYTKGYLQRRARVNSSYTYSDFGNYPASLSKVRLVPGQGIDGITNTFAAALWWIDFLMESTMYGFFDISIEGAIRPGNFQSVFGPPPTYTPTALYYGSIMGALIGDQIPNIVLPKYTAGTSSHIKVWGLELRTKNKFLILNKDTNTSLTGVVIIQTRSEKNVPMKCIYLQAPSLTEKTNILIGGHSYIAGNFTAQGPLKQLTFLYEPGVFGFSVPIKYAQAALCQIPNPDYIIPTMNADKKCYSPNYIYSLVGLTVSIIIILI